MFLLVLVPIIADWLKAPRIVFYIVGGAIVGPHLLNFLHRDDSMVLLGTIGLLYLIFLAGLQLDLNKFIKHKYQSLSFGLITFIIPFMIGTLVGLWLGYTIFTSLLMASLFASHTLIAYPVITRLGIVKNQAMTTAIGGIIVTDPGALLVLAVVVGAYSGDISADFWLLLGASVTVYLLIIYFIIPFVGRWFFRNSKSGGAVEYVFVLAILFLCAWLAAVAGLEPIIGAFLGGLALNRLIPENSVLMNRTRFIGEALFIPFFLLSVGMLVDISAFYTDLRTWVIAGAMIGAVAAGKGAAAWLARKTFGFTRAEGWTIFGLTVPQAAATLAVTLIAYDIGLFDDYILNGTIMMILVTCLLGPYMVEKYGKQIALAAERAPYNPSEAPERILVPLANPETSDSLMDVAFLVRDSDSEEPVYPLNVAADGKGTGEEVARGEKMLSHAVIHAASAEVPVIPVTRIDLNIANGIARAVSEMRISNVVIGWNGEVPARQRIFGSILDRLLQQVDEMVMVCKLEKPLNTLNRVLIAIPPLAALETGFPGAVRSVKLLAEQLGGEFVVVLTGEDTAAERERINRIKPDIDIEFHALGRWAELPGWLSGQLEEDDLFVMLSAREGTLSWRPGLDRLPRVISQSYPWLSFITIYPSEIQFDPSQSTLHVNRHLVQEGRVNLELKGENVREMLAHLLLTDGLFNPENVKSIVRRLSDNRSGYTPEVMPGLILFDAHTSKVNEQMLFAGISREGVNVEQTAHKVHMILILLSPKEMTPEEHLRGLNSAIKMVRREEVFRRMIEARSRHEVLEAIRSGDLQPG